MKITSFNPLIVTKDAEAAIALFEALGFERRHRKASLHGENITDVRLKDANGFHVDVMQMDDLSQDIRISQCCANKTKGKTCPGSITNGGLVLF